MTPFMRAVQDVVDGCAVPGPATEWSGPVPVPGATDAQVTLRSLAEQLVCEANAVLGDGGDAVDLEDQCGPGALGFTLTFRDRSAAAPRVVRVPARAVARPLSGPDRAGARPARRRLPMRGRSRRLHLRQPGFRHRHDAGPDEGAAVPARHLPRGLL